MRQLIRRGQSRTLQAAYTGQLTVYWQVGAYVYYRLQNTEWGEKTVEQFAIWLKEKEPTLKGVSRRSLYRMKEFYQTWHELDWEKLKKRWVRNCVNAVDTIIILLKIKKVEFSVHCQCQ